MSTPSPLDLSFLLMENSKSQMHMACYLILKVPQRQKNTFVPKLLKAYRTGEVAPPFNQQLRWLEKGVASWTTVEPDLNYHIRHLALPAPGTMQQFYQLISFLNAPLLDRNRPLWECYIIEGLQDNQCAVFIKVHHALLDGATGLKLFQNAMNKSARDTSIRAMWMPTEKQPKARQRASQSQLNKLVKRLGTLPGGLRGLGGELADLGAQTLKIKFRTTRLPFGANRTRLNNAPQSSERRYGNCGLPIERVKAVAKATGATVNDVLMAIIDHSLHEYLAGHGASVSKELVAMMPISTRKPGDANAGNQAAAGLVQLGGPDADILQRIQQIHESALQVKERSQRLPSGILQFYSLVTLGSGNLLEIATALQDMPSFNLVISNMIGPREQLYIGGVPLATFSGLPIVPPGGGLNVSFATIQDTVNIAVGAAPEAIEDPFLLTDLMLKNFQALDSQVLKKPAVRRAAPRKKANRKK